VKFPPLYHGVVGMRIDDRIGVSQVVATKAAARPNRCVKHNAEQ